MKLQIGVTYLTKDGRKVKIVECNKRQFMPYKGQYEDGAINRYREDGTTLNGTGNWADLVSVA